MDKESLQPLSGFRDLLGSPKPEIVARLREVFESFGFQALETPALERQEILLGKLGQEGEKQLYLFEDNGRRKVGLRYDLTVPLARFVAANVGSLTLPFKRYEIGPSWRAEKPQKGRFRQFWQADVDIVGVESISAECELLEVLAASQEVLCTFSVAVNDRRLITSVFEALKIAPEQSRKILQILDKRLKVEEATLQKELLNAGVTANQLKQIRALFLEADSLEAIERLVGEAATSDIRQLVAYGQSLGLEIDCQPSMVRGLDYYTGPIFEATAIEDETGVGTVVAGGRYDSLVASLIGQKIPAVGISFGVDRLVEIISEFVREPELFVVALPETEIETRSWARSLRQKGMIVEVYPDASAPMGRQIKYADKKGYLSVYLPLEDEWKRGEIVQKDLATGTQTIIKRAEV